MSVDVGTKPASDFPYLTVLATLAALFLFVGLVMIAYRSPNYLGESQQDAKPDPATKLQDVRVRNEAVLDGVDPGVIMSVGDAAAQLAATADTRKDEKNPRGALPFPIEPKTKDSK